VLVWSRCGLKIVAILGNSLGDAQGEGPNPRPPYWTFQAGDWAPGLGGGVRDGRSSDRKGCGTFPSFGTVAGVSEKSKFIAISNGRTGAHPGGLRRRRRAMGAVRRTGSRRSSRQRAPHRRGPRRARWRAGFDADATSLAANCRNGLMGHVRVRSRHADEEVIRGDGVLDHRGEGSARGRWRGAAAARLGPAGPPECVATRRRSHDADRE
jgi:hypothetical protein